MILRNKLLEMQEAKKKWQKLCGNSYMKDYLEFVYVDELGDRIKPDYITQSFDTLISKNGFRDFRFHDLRHSCAGFLLANGMSMKEVQDIRSRTKARNPVVSSLCWRRVRDSNSC